MARLPPAISTSEAAAFLAEARSAVDAALAHWQGRVRRELPGPVGDAVIYALEGPGKRLRPALTLAVYRAAGGTGDAAELAAAIEVVHTYSLIHDDLPCMDDDDLRRGRPTVHRVFGVPVATEAGFRMVPLAARVLATGAARLGLDRGPRRAIARALFAAAGAGGMIGGQVLDLEAEGGAPDAAALFALHAAKTGAMIAASAEIGALAAGLSAPRRAAVREFGEELGVAFQIHDDLLDVAGSSQSLGKTAGKDARQHKATSVTVLGEAAARAEAGRRLDRGIARLRAAGLDSGILVGLARFVVDRRS
jgi:farnesyl diphosphate synthase/geranylgeranyl diphosphate synthase type II